VDARRPTFRSDVYSLGVLFLELLTCKSPAHHASLEGGDGTVDLPRWVQSVVREEWTAEVFGSAPPVVRPPGCRGLRLLLQVLPVLVNLICRMYRKITFSALSQIYMMSFVLHLYSGCMLKLLQFADLSAMGSH
jgi:hypothetical protein